MDPAKVEQHTLCQLFSDHTGQRALSVTHPVHPDIQRKHYETQRLHPGALESDYRFPCFQIYFPYSEGFLETAQSQREAIQHVLALLSSMHQMSFFLAFGGIRFEVYNGCQKPQSELGRAQSSSTWLESISDHSRQEREHRNTLEIFRALAQSYMSKRFKEVFMRQSSEGASQEELHLLGMETNSALQNLCSIGELLCPKIAKLNRWRESRHSEQLTVRKRSNTGKGFDMMLRLGRPLDSSFPYPRRHTWPVAADSNVGGNVYWQTRMRSRSTGGVKIGVCLTSEQRRYEPSQIYRVQLNINPNDLPLVPDRKVYIRIRLERLARELLSKFYAPLTPASVSSGVHQPWRSAVLLLKHPDIATRGAHIMLSDRDETFDNVVQNYDSTWNGFACRLIPVSANRDLQALDEDGSYQKHAHVAIQLGRLLKSFGLVKSNLAQLLQKPTHLDPATQSN